MTARITIRAERSHTSIHSVFIASNFPKRFATITFMAARIHSHTHTHITHQRAAISTNWICMCMCVLCTPASVSRRKSFSSSGRALLMLSLPVDRMSLSALLSLLFAWSNFITNTLHVRRSPILLPRSSVHTCLCTCHICASAHTAHSRS